jgi:hypothetical protein
VNQTIMVLDFNADVMERLRDFYRLLVKEDGRLPGDGARKALCRADVETFASEVTELVHDVKMQAARARILSKLIKDRKEIVSPILYSPVVERLNPVSTL